MPYILVMVALVLMSAYFSATETAFTSINKTRLKNMAEKGDKRASLVLSIAENYDKLLSTILVGNNIVNIALASMGTVLFVKLFPDYGAAISTAVITIVVLIFGEISPKSIAKDTPEKFAMFSAPFIRLLIWILTPLNFLFSLWKKLLAKIIKVEESAKMSQEELLVLVDEVEQDGTIDTDEGDLLRNAIEFTEQRAEDVLTHRVDIEAVPIDADKIEVARLFSQTRFSRLLVFDESIDNIVGVIHLKDFYNEDGITDKSIEELMSVPVFVQRSEKINDLLKELQTNKSHIAVILDEFGGTLGIVTMEDILEELVGEIWDEHDEVIEDFELIEENKYIVDCSADFEDFCEQFGIEADEEIASISGWVMEQLDRVPETGDVFDYQNLNITVTETDYHRVEKIHVIVNEPEIDDETNDDN
ncbi:MAG: HlyC/CorC family transporter [Clostridia bacterium]|nr:HlyC/CorC family transporter [Clostridia bacterium]